jgi:hypothetical protein
MAELHRLMAAIDEAQREADAASEARRVMLIAVQARAARDLVALRDLTARHAAAARAYERAVAAFDDARARLSGDCGEDPKTPTGVEQDANAAYPEAEEEQSCHRP